MHSLSYVATKRKRERERESHRRVRRVEKSITQERKIEKERERENRNCRRYKAECRHRKNARRIGTSACQQPCLFHAPVSLTAKLERSRNWNWPRTPRGGPWLAPLFNRSLCLIASRYKSREFLSRPPICISYVLANFMLQHGLSFCVWLGFCGRWSLPHLGESGRKRVNVAREGKLARKP